MKSLAALVICALTLASCTTLNNAMPGICTAATFAYAGVMSYASTGKIGPKTLKNVQTAKAAVDVICNDPDFGDNTPEETMIRLVGAAAVISKAYREAKANDD
jgi:hypothetical protein